MKERLFKSRLTLVVLGISLGYLARLVLGVPTEDEGPSRVINRPLPEMVEPDAEEVIDLPIIKRDENGGSDSGLVPPIRMPGMFPTVGAHFASSGNTLLKTVGSEFSHAPEAVFEPHGEKICASGCAASRHPTEKLTRENYQRLLKELTYEPMDQTNNALESLMYYGPQTRQMIEAHGVGDLETERAKFLWEQLKFDRAMISIRVVDDEGEIRTWIDATEVPFDRRHVFDMQTNDVQPLVTSGTVKRVGLNHIWARL